MAALLRTFTPVREHGRRSFRPSVVASACSCGFGIGAAVAVNQALDLRKEWETKNRAKAWACQGPTEGCEQRWGVSATSSFSTGASESESGPVLLLFLGDSLVSGVGGQASDAPEPAVLPRKVAAELADRLQGEVRWASVGITGADVERLEKEGLPRLREKVANCNARKVVVVLVAGANDLRKLRFSYRLRLRNLVDELHHLTPDAQVGAVFVPALAMADAPMLQRWPLKFFLQPLCMLWEREKRKAINLFHDVEILPFPAPPEGVEMEALFSADLMHPSISGYEWWAKNMAESIHRQLHLRAM
eukprot:CAMPEP_0197635982 /NCGR_PEP_ID=MMETSP1338-20131121/11629_1 /TAXON_ID=43686 ORGANISM="Pelagodinium beii, Strain RCC1491" /NCGR_SAMPLE_ID=MMETSP1338 /ASSEMBLY_ACC=CAM_ASM_000754 /LENGTH=303 /DNA_ID=CAMNT_0043208127 /DNA_START=29 /DNA_END=940 /DNA_ORIENTATION=-